MSYAKKKELVLSTIDELKKSFPLQIINGAKKTLEDTEARAMQTDSFEIGLLGQAQNGKSTLLNALIGDKQYPEIFPSGGTGPLTAVAVTVRYGETRSLEVKYHGHKKILSILRSLNIKIGGYRRKNLTDAHISQLMISDENISQLKILIAGPKSEDRDYKYLLLVAMHLAKKGLFSDLDQRIVTQYPEDEVNYQKVLNIITMDVTEKNFTENTKDFLEQIKDHSAGCLSPLVCTLKVTWPAEVLKNNVIISDLPGVGTVSDSYITETKNWLQSKCRSLILVVRNNGIDTESVRYLKQSGFLESLLWDKDQIQLIVAVTHMDHKYNGIHGIQNVPEEFMKECENMQSSIRKQLSNVLTKILLTRVEEDVKFDRLRIIDKVMSNVVIVAGSPFQYILSLTNYRTKLFEDVITSNLPILRDQIIKRAKIYFDEKKNRLDRGLDQCLKQIGLSIVQLEHSPNSETHPIPVPMQIITNFNSSFETLSSQLRARQAGFKTYLDTTIPSQINLLIIKAETNANIAYSKFIQEEIGPIAHYKTLMAVVKYGGCYEGKMSINLPETLASMLSERIPTSFQSDILKPLQEQAMNLIKSHRIALSEVIKWIETNNIPQVVRDKIKNLELQLNLVSEALENEGVEEVEEFRKAVKRDLKTVIDGSIRTYMEDFINREDSVGEGVKERMLDLFKEAGTKALKSAEEETKEMIGNKYETYVNKMLNKSSSIYRRDLIKDVRDILERPAIIRTEAEQTEINLEKEKLSKMKDLIKNISENTDDIKTA